MKPWIPQRRSAFVAVLLLAAALPCAAPAQNKDSRERQALRHAEQLVGQLQQEKQGLEQAKADAEQKLATATRDMSKLKAEQDRSKSRIAQFEHAIDEWQRQNDELKAKLAAAEHALDESHKGAESTQQRLEQQAVDSQRRWDGQKKDLDAGLVQQHEAFQQQQLRGAACEQKNARLAALTLEVMRRYKEKSVWDVLRDSELVTGLGSVQAENLLQDYRDKVDAETVRPGVH